MSAQPYILIISHDVVGSHMAGPGIRYWEMAQTLAREHGVTLVAPHAIDLQPSEFSTASYRWGDATSLHPFLLGARRVIANGYVLDAHPELAAIEQPLALDLYDPVLLENLELGRDKPPEQRTTRNRQDIQLLNRQLAAGDFFLCATERQRDLYLGALMAAGRITPRRTEHDPLLRGLIDVAPFGLPGGPPTKQEPALRGVLDGIAHDDLLLLWGGGLWDWLDPLTVVRAMPQIVAVYPNTRLAFLAGTHPGDIAVMRRPQETKAEATALGLLNTHVFFYESWVPYGRRADFLLEADIAVSLHHNHLETAYAAVRSRFLDYLWAGLPSVVGDGDAAAVLVHRHRLGRVVPTGDRDKLAAALLELLADPNERYACGANARALAGQFTWEHCLTPLSSWCRTIQRKDQERLVGKTYPHVLDGKPTTPDGQLGENDLAEDDQQRNTVLQQLDQHWQIGEQPVPPGLLTPLRRFMIRHFVRPFVVPLIERQNTYNGLVAKALYALAESSDRRRSVVQRRLDDIERHAGRAEGQMQLLQERLQQLQERLQQVEQESRDMQQRMLDLEDADTTLAEQLLVRGVGATTSTSDES